MTQTPTKVPWEWGWGTYDMELKAYPVVVTSEARDICTIESYYGDDEANAAFIVRACNAHEQLVEALRAMLDAGRYDDAGNFVVDCEQWDGQGDPPDITSPKCIQQAWGLVDALVRGKE